MITPLARREFLSPKAPGTSPWSRIVRLAPLALALVTLLAMLTVSDTAFARSRTSNHKRNAAAAAARKKKTIESIRSQIAAAEQVLAAAEASGGVSQAQLDEIRKRIVSTKEAMEKAADEEQEARQELRELEQEILEDQPPDSEFGRAQQRLAAARGAVEKLRTEYNGNWSRLSDDANYLGAAERLNAAKREADRVRAALLAKDEDWQDASKQLRQLLAEHREERESGSVSLGKMSAARDLRDAQQIAAAARQVIAVGEVQLRKMGEKVSSTTASPKKKTVKK